MKNSFVYQTSTPEYTVSPISEFKGYEPHYGWLEEQETEPTPEPVFEQPVQETSQETVQETEPAWESPSTLSFPTGRTGSYRLRDGVTLGNMQEAVEELAKYLHFDVTSGTREGATTSNGSRSHHASGNAIDIVPTGGQTYDDWLRILRENPALSQYLQSKNLGILQETTPEMLARTGGTGPHWHIGPDRSAIEGLETILSGKKGFKLLNILKKEAQ